MMKLCSAAFLVGLLAVFVASCQASSIIEAPAGPVELPDTFVSFESGPVMNTWCNDAFNPDVGNYWDPNTPLFVDGAIVIPADVDRQLDTESSINFLQSNDISTAWCAGAFMPEPVDQNNQFVTPTWNNINQIPGYSRPFAPASSIRYVYDGSVWCSGAGMPGAGESPAPPPTEAPNPYFSTGTISIDAIARPEYLSATGISFGAASQAWCENAFSPVDDGAWDVNTPLFLEATTLIISHPNLQSDTDVSIGFQRNGTSPWCTGAFSVDSTSSSIEPSWDGTLNFWFDNRPLQVESAVQTGFVSSVWCSGSGISMPGSNTGAPSPAAPVQVPVSEPNFEPVYSPTAEPVPQPFAGPIAESASQPIVEAAPSGETVSEPFAQTVEEPVSEPISSPVQEPVTAPVSEPFAEPLAEPVSEPFAEPLAEPISEPFAEPVAAPMFEPALAPVAQPVAEPRPEPIAEPRPEPIAEPRPEPIAEPRPEPIAEPIEESAAEPAAAPVAQPVATPVAAPTRPLVSTPVAVPAPTAPVASLVIVFNLQGSTPPSTQLVDSICQQVARSFSPPLTVGRDIQCSVAVASKRRAVMAAYQVMVQITSPATETVTVAQEAAFQSQLITSVALTASTYTVSMVVQVVPMTESTPVQLPLAPATAPNNIVPPVSQPTPPTNVSSGANVMAGWIGVVITISVLCLVKF